MLSYPSPMQLPIPKEDMHYQPGSSNMAIIITDRQRTVAAEHFQEGVKQITLARNISACAIQSG